MGKLFTQMAANTSGRDFVVGDLHGNYNRLVIDFTLIPGRGVPVVA